MWFVGLVVFFGSGLNGVSVVFFGRMFLLIMCVRIYLW